MFNIKIPKINNKQEKNGLLAIVFALLFFSIFILKINSSVLLAVSIFIIMFIFTKQYSWVLLCLAPPALSLGLTFSLPITEQWRYDITLAEIFILVVAFDFVINMLFRMFYELKFSLLNYALAFYLSIATLSGFYAHDKQLFLAGLKIPVFALLAYTLAGYYLRTAERIKWFMAGLLLTAVIISAQIVFLFYANGFSSRFFFDRSSLSVPIGAIAFASSILVMIIPVLFSFSLTQIKNYVWHAMSIIAFTLGFIAIFITLGKGAILSLAIGLGFLFLALKHKRYYLFLISVTIITVLSLLFSALFANIFERLTAVFIDNNTRFRWREYKIIWRIIKENYWLGVGMGQQLHYYSLWLYPGYQQLANNMVLQMAMDLGALGLAIFVFIATALRKIVKKAFVRASDYYPVLLYGICASIIASFFNGLVEVTYFGLAYAIIFWLLMGIIPNVHIYEKHFSYNH